ncbi:MAG: 2OG-Fe(II) oxygenase [Steroidobacteraceae bacterium]|jgi:SM-20-related protein
MRAAVEALLATGVAVHDGFLDARALRALRTCAERRMRGGEFRPASIGAGGDRLRHAEIRGDSICWLAEPRYAAERDLLRELEQLRLGLNLEAGLGVFELELQYAWYPPGAGYARHVDQPHGRTARRVSLAIYLNARWDPRAGGELRLYDAAGACLDVEPKGGRLVWFLTPGREHEVRPARCGRWSLSGWFCSRP